MSLQVKQKIQTVKIEKISTGKRCKRQDLP